MNCRSFEYQVADWLAGRLPPERSQRLAEHRASCASCARAAEAEERSRKEWRGLDASPVPDFWPRLALRLEDQQIRQRQPWATTPRRGWAWGGTAILASVTLGGLLLWPKPLAPTERPQSGPRIVERSATLSGLPDVSQVDPAVDDPAGTSMENVWTQIDTTAPKADGR